MQKILKLTGVSILAIVAAANANAAGYTCEELIEYTSCNAGYYLSHQDGTCPDGYTYSSFVSTWEEEYRSWDSEEDFLNACEENGFTGEDGCWYSILGAGCYKNWECEECEEYWQSDFTPATTSGTTTCSECPAGSYCVGGDKTTAVATMCAAGTYQPEKKQASCLTTPVGNYSLAGAENYTACPTTGLKDKDGKTVTATTSGDGATSIMSCYVGPEWYFNDTKGTYHFTSNCNAFDLATATSAEKNARCTSMGGSWNSGGYCEIDFVYPTTESTCNEFDFCNWDGGCDCDCSGYPSVDLENGQTYCHDAP